MTRLLGLTVARNEADRYLVPMLSAVVDIVDDHFLYDDQSDDHTAQIAADLGATVVVRPDTVPPYMQHEGRCRYGAWQAFLDRLNPQPGDWILGIDADEFLITTDECPIRGDVDNAITTATATQTQSVLLPVKEFFGFKGTTPLVRTDGFWGKIAGTRLYAFQGDGDFWDKPMGSGSEPTYVQRSPISKQSYGLHLLHYGYVRVADQRAKFDRYTGLLDHGHNNSHVRSILTPPTLVPWDGPVPWVPSLDAA